MLRPCVEPARSRPVPSHRSWSAAGRGCLLRRRARQRSGIQIHDLVSAFGELPAFWGAPVAVVVDGVGQMGTAGAHVPETQDVCTAGRGVALKLDCARVRGLHEVVPETLPQPLDPGADLLPADELDVDDGDPPNSVLCDQRGEAVVV